MSNLLLWGDSERFPALRHEVPLAIIDPFLFAELDGRKIVLTNDLERARIAAVLPEAELLDFDELGMRDLLAQGWGAEAAEREVAATAVRRLGLTETIVPSEFPVGLADRLRADGITLSVDDELVQRRRRAKTPRELEAIGIAQRAAEAGMAAAAGLLARAEPDREGKLVLDGSPLRSEDVRDALREACAEHGAPCPPDVIVASVWNGYGHEPGSGPLPAGLPITIDLWPRHEQSGYWADMTRTFVVGEPEPDHAELIAEQERLVREALEAARAGIRPGRTGGELHDETCERFEAAGFATQRTARGQNTSEGFQFSLGHGVGLALHEAPAVGMSGREQLVAGDVLAIEPGLWDIRIGGVRFEDLVLVTEDGCETLTRYPYDLDPRGAAAAARGSSGPFNHACRLRNGETQAAS